ncbi:MAG TPA: transcriptional repressor LexA [Actinomycetota bacterium]
MSELTKRQQQILHFIRNVTEQRGYPPSVREIGDAVGLNSPSSVHAQLATLARHGYLSKDASKPRAIVVRMDSEGIPVEAAAVEHVPLIGRIAAGGPILAQENFEDTLPLPRDMLGSGTLFALRVQGDSMIDAGILDADLVIVRQQPDALDGEIVAALVDGEEATVKRLQRKRGKVQLIAENPAYEPLTPDEVSILGKVVAVFRTNV